METYTNADLRSFETLAIAVEKKTYIQTAAGLVEKYLYQKAHLDSAFVRNVKKQETVEDLSSYYLQLQPNQFGLYKLKIDLPLRVPCDMLQSLIPRFNPVSLLPSVIEEVNKKFPELVIQVDPLLKSYLLIDWSQSPISVEESSN